MGYSFVFLGVFLFARENNGSNEANRSFALLLFSSTVQQVIEEVGDLISINGRHLPSPKKRSKQYVSTHVSTILHTNLIALCLEVEFFLHILDHDNAVINPTTPHHILSLKSRKPLAS